MTTRPANEARPEPPTALRPRERAAPRAIARPIAPCAEMPNDNPALHRGAIWTCLEPVGPAVVAADDAAQQGRPDPFTTTSDLLPDLDALVPPPRHSEIRRIAPDGTLGASLLDEPEPEPAPELAPAGAVLALVRPAPRATAAPVAAPGAPAPAPAAEDPVRTLGALLQRLVVERGGADAGERLARVLAGDQPLAARLARAFSAWSRLLRGEAVDFGETDGTMLDEWAALVCAAALDGAPGSASVTELRRELRARGVAAFGLVAAA